MYEAYKFPAFQEEGEAVQEGVREGVWVGMRVVLM